MKIVLVCVLALVLQLTVFVDVRVGSVAPELLALVAILAAAAVGPERGSTIAFGAGLLWDIYLPTPLGLAALAFALSAYAVGSVEAGLFHDSRVQVMVLAALGTAGAVTVYALLGWVVGQDGLVSGALIGIVIRASLANAVLALVAAPVVRWALQPGIGVRAALAR